MFCSEHVIQKSFLIRLGGIGLAVVGLCLVWLQAQQPPPDGGLT
jgi:hypothetical protein